VSAIFADEELPEHLFDELMFRLAATDGYFKMVFTATLAQEFWRQAIEGRGDEERFPEANKQQVTMYDCLMYEDGSPGAYTEAKISRIKAMCKSESEIQKRVYGKFVADSGIIYETFERARHLTKRHPLPPTWKIFCGIDVGSGGDSGHPAAIVFIALSPNHQQLRVVATWRGDGVLTTSADIFNKYMEMKRGLGYAYVTVYYDYAAKDLGTIAARLGEPFLQANKSIDTGESVVNVLFKNDMLKVFDGMDADKLVTELLTVRRKKHSKQKNDLSDALRYGIVDIPIDWTVIQAPVVEDKKPIILDEREERRQAFDVLGRSEDDIVKEFDEWNEAYG
jgi:hypothetical protein